MKNEERAGASNQTEQASGVPATQEWRVGSRVPLNVYKGDRPICQCHDGIDAAEIVRAMNERERSVPATQECECRKTLVKEMVNRFLAWRLPNNFNPDGGISFNPHRDAQVWPIGTNLLDADQAEAMIQHVLFVDKPCPCTQLRQERDSQYQRAQSLQDSLLSEICRADKAEEERDGALRVRDLAREASQRDLEAKRDAEAECDSLRTELDGAKHIADIWYTAYGIWKEADIWYTAYGIWKEHQR